MRFSVLGPIRFERDGKWHELRAPMRRRLLGVLLSRAGETLLMDTLVDALWPDDPPAQAAKAVGLNVLRLRRDLGDPARLVTAGGGVALVVHPGELDAVQFGKLIRSGVDARAAGDPDRAMALFDEAIALWSGAPYSGLDDCGFVQLEVERLVQLRLGAIEERAGAGLEAGRHLELVPELTRLVLEFPYQEGLVGQLMLALYRAGRQADALEVFTAARERLSDDLGTDPGPELQQLHERVLRRTPDLHLSQALTGDRPVPAQLPADLASFVGRRQELRELTALAEAGAVAVIHGMGGVGKTSLAVRVAHAVAADFPDGQIFLDLRGFTPDATPLDPHVALERLLGRLGSPPDQIPSDTDDRAALWRTRLAGRRILLVFDNVAGVDQLTPLLPGAPGCLVLATSRRGLTALDDARLISLETLSQREATSLVRQVVGEHRMSREPPELLDALVDLCGRLPLAVRIAAARWRARSGWRLADLVGRLTDERQRLAELEVPGRSVESVLWLSYRELSSAPRRLFRLLALHPGIDFDVHAAAAVLDTDVGDTARLLDELVDAHLLHVDGDRFSFHDLVRTLALAVLSREEPEDEQRAAQSRLADCYCCSTSAAMDLIAPEDRARRPQPPAVPRFAPRLNTREEATAYLDAELSNLVAVAGHHAGIDQPAVTYHLAETLRQFLAKGRYGHEALALHSHAVRTARQGTDPIRLGRCLVRLGHAHLLLDRHSDAERHLREAMGYLDVDSPDVDLALAFQHLVRVSIGFGRFHDAISYGERAIELFQHCGDENRRLHTLLILAETNNLLGDTRTAAAHEAEARRMLFQVGDDIDATYWHMTSAETHLLRGENPQAIDHAEKALAHAGTRRTQHVFSQLNDLLGRTYAAVDKDKSFGCHQRALAIADELEHLGLQGDAARGFAESLLAYDQAAVALPLARRAVKHSGDAGWPHDVARSHRCLGNCYDRLGDSERASDHWKEALRIFESLHVPDADELRVLLS